MELTPETIRHLDKALCGNNITLHYAQNSGQALEIAREFLPDGCAVAVGGSLTLRQTGIQQFIEEGNFHYTSRYVPGSFQIDDSLPQCVVRQSYMDAYQADVYFTGANALTMAGELVYVDGQGNRISAIAYGPRQVVNVVGCNKLVQDRQAAFHRIKTLAAPANNRRYKRTTPCVTLGYCVDCKNSQRGCSDYLVVSHQKTLGRMHVILVNAVLGM